MAPVCICMVVWNNSMVNSVTVATLLLLTQNDNCYVQMAYLSNISLSWYARADGTSWLINIMDVLYFVAYPMLSDIGHTIVWWSHVTYCANGLLRSRREATTWPSIHEAVSCHIYTGLILCVRQAYERRSYFVTTSLIG